MRDRTNKAEFAALKVNINDRIALNELIIETRKKEWLCKSNANHRIGRISKTDKPDRESTSDLQQRKANANCYQ